MTEAMFKLQIEWQKVEKRDWHFERIKTVNVYCVKVLQNFLNNFFLRFSETTTKYPAKSSISWLKRLLKWKVSTGKKTFINDVISFKTPEMSLIHMNPPQGIV